MSDLFRFGQDLEEMSNDEIAALSSEEHMIRQWRPEIKLVQLIFPWGANPLPRRHAARLRQYRDTCAEFGGIFFRFFRHLEVHGGSFAKWAMSTWP